jgi:hypothetical protein
VTSALTWSGFSNGSVTTSISTDSPGTFINIAAGQFPGYNFISVETTPTLLQLTASEPGTLLRFIIASLALLTAMRRRQTA